MVLLLLHHPSASLQAEDTLQAGSKPPIPGHSEHLTPVLFSRSGSLYERDTRRTKPAQVLVLQLEGTVRFALMCSSEIIFSLDLLVVRVRASSAQLLTSVLFSSAGAPTSPDQSSDPQNWAVTSPEPEQNQRKIFNFFKSFGVKVGSFRFCSCLILKMSNICSNLHGRPPQRRSSYNNTPPTPPSALHF